MSSTPDDRDKLSPEDRIRFAGALPPIRVRRTTCPACGATNDHRATSEEAHHRLLRDAGHLRVPEEALGFAVGAPARFPALCRTIAHAASTVLAGLGLVVVEVPERNLVLLVGEVPPHVALDAVAEQLGARVAREAIASAGQWVCGRRCLAVHLRRVVGTANSAIVNGDATAAVDRVVEGAAATGRVDEAPSGDVVVACAGSCGEARQCPRRIYDDEKLWEGWLRANGFLPHGPRGAVHRTCAAAAEREARPLKPVVDRDEMIRRYGERFVPKSMAEEVYKQVHGGKTPQEVGADLEAAKRATAAGAKPFRQRRGGGTP